MNELNAATESAFDTSEPRVKPSSAGAILRAAREAQGLHIAMLAVSLKVPVRKLEALESDRYDLLPDMVFVRALAAGVCRILRMDVGPVLAALPPSCHPQIKIADAGLNTTYNDGSASASKTWLRHLGAPLNLTVLFVIFAILVIVFFPEEWLGKNPSTSKNGDDETVSVAKPGVSSSVGAPVVSTAAQRLIPPSDPVKMIGVAEAIPRDDAHVVPVASTQKSAETGPESSVGNNALVLKALGDSWVEVKDAQGGLQLRRMLKNGEAISVSGILPMSVVLGRADLVSVFVRGKPLDTTSVTKENVARFEVK